MYWYSPNENNVFYMHETSLETEYRKFKYNYKSFSNLVTYVCMGNSCNYWTGHAIVIIKYIYNT